MLGIDGNMPVSSSSLHLCELGKEGKFRSNPGEYLERREEQEPAAPHPKARQTKEVTRAVKMSWLQSAKEEINFKRQQKGNRLRYF